MIDFNTPFQVVPFHNIRPEHYKPAFDLAINEAKNHLDKIISSSEKPTFKNTIEALEQAGYLLKRIEQVFFNINSAETSKEIQQIAQEISPVLTGYYNDITLNSELFRKIRQVYNEREKLGLNTEQEKLLEDTYKTFVRSGANLDSEAKEDFRKITVELSKLNLKFEENLLDETNSYQLHVTNENDLTGLPDYVKEAAALEAKHKKLVGWVFTLKAPSYQSFMKFAYNRKLREEMYRAYNSRCFHKNEKDNQEIIRNIVTLRLRLANLLGYKTYADYVLEDRMAQNTAKVTGFLQELLDASLLLAQNEYKELQAYAQKYGASFDIERWDWTYYSERLKNEKFLITDEIIKPYFQLEKVEQGIFD
jgi:peptidyl-dipeptidase Dcp